MPSGKNLEVLSALDNAKTQWYHFTAIVIAGMGFFTDAYDLFCITCVSKLLGRLYYYDPATNKPGVLPTNVNDAVTGVALVGTLAGQVFFGWLGDKLGRKKVYGTTLLMMVVSAIGSGLSFGSDSKTVMTTLCFFRFWLGFGIGGDYPLSATIMSEYANQKTRGGFVAAVFAMQGVGIVAAGGVSMIVSKSFGKAFPAQHFDKDQIGSTRHQADYVWRIILMFGAVPALLTYYWRLKMPETARFTALVAGNTEQAAEDMAKVLDVELQIQSQKVNPAESYKLFSKEFLRRHGLHLLGTSSTWFLLDIAFYSNNLTQKDVYTSIGLLPHPSSMNAIDEVYKISKAQFLIALFGTVPGYWFTVFLIDRIGRFIIQLVGFIMMSAFMLALGVLYKQLRGDPCKTSKSGYCSGNPLLFAVLYALTFFFANFGPNSTTFVVPAELFPARLRSTCHGISAAAGKAGAIFSAFVIQRYTQNPKNVGNIKTSLIFLAAVNFCGFLFTFLVPETKGRSLEEISGEDQETQNSNAKPQALNNVDVL